jgi:tetratricopeptide (TPR) repeat protein
MKRSVWLAILLGLIAFCSAPARARADEPQLSEAEALFQHGVELMKADQCAEAVPEFLKSNALDASAATLLNLGTCYARLGRKASAWKAYQKAALAAQSESNDALRERATQALSILGPTLTKVQIVTPKGSTALALRLNGEALSDYDGLPIPLDPGQSVIEAAAPGREPWRKTVTADDVGATLVIEVPDLRTADLPPPRVASQPQPQPQPQPPPPKPERALDLRVPAAVTGGAGLVALAIGTAFGLGAQGTYSDSRSNCVGNRCTQAGIDQRDSARSKAAASTVLFSVGIAAVATGVVMWLVSPAAAQAKQASNRRPIPEVRSAW